MSSPIATAAMSAASRASRPWRLPRVTGAPPGATGGRDGTETDPPAAAPRVDAPSPGASSLRARPMLHLRPIPVPHSPSPPMCGRLLAGRRSARPAFPAMSRSYPIPPAPSTRWVRFHRFESRASSLCISATGADIEPGDFRAAQAGSVQDGGEVRDRLPDP